MIRFRKECYKRPFLNPLNNFQEETQELEVRFDPLLDHCAMFNPALEDKVKLFFGKHDWALVEKLAQKTQETCFMCPPKVYEVTPAYPEDFLPEKRLTKGECTLFPNLFPIALRHAVITVGHAHFRQLKDFSPPLITDGLSLGIEFLRRLKRDPEALVGVICANYLPPAGASLVHPHFQVVASRESFPYLRHLYEKSFMFYQDHGQNFWDLLVAREREERKRFIRKIGRVNFITSFAPLGANEILAVIQGVHALEELEQKDLEDLGQGIAAILSGYQTLGYGTFNFSLFMPPLKERSPWFNPLLRIITRQNMYENYRTDDYFLQRQLGAELILTPPEKLATHMRGVFQED